LTRANFASISAVSSTTNPLLISLFTEPRDQSSVPVQSLRGNSSLTSGDLVIPLQLRPTIIHKTAMTSRIASHAGSWYTEDPKALSAELDRFLGRVPSTIEDHPVPVPGARVIIAP
jgi:hypothetical protein